MSDSGIVFDMETKTLTVKGEDIYSRTFVDRVEESGGIEEVLKSVPEEQHYRFAKFYNAAVKLRASWQSYEPPEEEKRGPSEDDLEDVDGHGWNALHHACSDGDVEKVTKLFQNPEAAKKALQEEEYDDYTPFELACRRGHLEVVEYLLSVAPDVIPELISFFTLYRLVYEYQLDILNLLVPLAKSEVFLETDEKNRTLLHRACKSQDRAMIELFIKYSPPSVYTAEDYDECYPCDLMENQRLAKRLFKRRELTTCTCTPRHVCS